MEPTPPAPVNEVNCLRLDGELLEREALRYTPAGIPICQALIAHDSVQLEAGGQRQVRLHMQARFAGPLAERLSREALGTQLVVEGFLSHRRLSREGKPGGPTQLHVTAYSTQNSTR